MSLDSSTTQITSSLRRGSVQMRHFSSAETFPQISQKRTVSLTWTSTSASRRTAASSASSRWNAIRCADLGPMPGSLPSSSMRSWTMPSYTRLTLVPGADVRRRRRGGVDRCTLRGRPDRARETSIRWRSRPTLDAENHGQASRHPPRRRAGTRARGPRRPRRLRRAGRRDRAARGRVPAQHLRDHGECGGGRHHLRDHRRHPGDVAAGLRRAADAAAAARGRRGGGRRGPCRAGRAARRAAAPPLAVPRDRPVRQRLQPCPGLLPLGRGRDRARESLGVGAQVRARLPLLRP